MEKQYHSNSNFLMLNHLPRIFSMMHILNMIVYGFVASQPVFFISAISSLQKSIWLTPSQPGKRLNKQLLFRLRNLYYVTLTTGVLLVTLVNSSSVNLLFVIAPMALVCLGTQLYTMNKRNIPATRIIYLRNYTMQRADLKNDRDKWLYYFHRYRITDLLALLSLLLAAS